MFECVGIFPMCCAHGNRVRRGFVARAPHRLKTGVTDDYAPARHTIPSPERKRRVASPPAGAWGSDKRRMFAHYSVATCFVAAVVLGGCARPQSRVACGPAADARSNRGLLRPAGPLTRGRAHGYRGLLTGLMMGIAFYAVLLSTNHLFALRPVMLIVFDAGPPLITLAPTSGSS